MKTHHLMTIAVSAIFAAGGALSQNAVPSGAGTDGVIQIIGPEEDESLEMANILSEMEKTAADIASTQAFHQAVMEKIHELNLEDQQEYFSSGLLLEMQVCADKSVLISKAAQSSALWAIELKTAHRKASVAKRKLALELPSEEQRYKSLLKKLAQSDPSSSIYRATKREVSSAFDSYRLIKGYVEGYSMRLENIQRAIEQNQHFENNLSSLTALTKARVADARRAMDFVSTTSEFASIQQGRASMGAMLSKTFNFATPAPGATAIAIGGPITFAPQVDEDSDIFGSFADEALDPALQAELDAMRRELESIE